MAVAEVKCIPVAERNGLRPTGIYVLPCLLAYITEAQKGIDIFYGIVNNC